MFSCLFQRHTLSHSPFFMSVNTRVPAGCEDAWEAWEAWAVLKGWVSLGEVGRDTQGTLELLSTRLGYFFHTQQSSFLFFPVLFGAVLKTPLSSCSRAKCLRNSKYDGCLPIGRPHRAAKCRAVVCSHAAIDWWWWCNIICVLNRRSSISSPHWGTHSRL